MVRQKAISFKIYTDSLKQLDEEVALSWKGRNTMINEAVAMYLEYLEARRRQKLAESQGQKVSDEALAFIKRYLVPNVHYFLGRVDE